MISSIPGRLDDFSWSIHSRIFFCYLLVISTLGSCEKCAPDNSLPNI